MFQHGNSSLRNVHGLRRLPVLLLLCLTGVGTTYAQSPTVTVTGANGVEPGANVAVTIDLSHLSNLGALLFDLTYNATLVSLEGINVTGQLASQGLFASNPETFPSSTGRLRFGFLKADGLSGDGTLVVLTFKVASDAAGQVPLGIEGITGAGTDLTDQTLTGINGAIGVVLAVIDIGSGLRLFTIPVNLATPDPAATLGEAAATVKLAAWDPKAQSGAGAYVVYDGTNVTFQPGIGYFTKRDAGKRLTINAGTPVDTNSSFSINLSKGWNLLGNPYRSPISWDRSQLHIADAQGTDKGALEQASNADLVDDYAWVWDGTSYQLVFDTTLLPTATGAISADGGFWFYSNQDNLKLVFAPGQIQKAEPTRQPVTRAQPTMENWDLQLVARTGDIEDDYNLIGVRPSGTFTGGRKLIVSPPRATDVYVDLYLTGDGQTRSDQRLAADLREPLHDTTAWDFVVETNVADADVTVAWPNMMRVPKAYGFMLTDRSTGAQRYMRTTAGYTFHSGPHGDSRAFRIEVMPAGLARLRISNLQFTPGRSGSGGSIIFSLSQRARITLEIRTPTGRTVATIAPAEMMSAGLVHLDWNGRSRSGLALPRGYYLISAVAETETGQQVRAVQTIAMR